MWSNEIDHQNEDKYFRNVAFRGRKGSEMRN